VLLLVLPLCVCVAINLYISVHLRIFFEFFLRALYNEIPNYFRATR